MRSLFRDFDSFVRQVSKRARRSSRRQMSLDRHRHAVEVLESRWVLSNVLTYHGDIASTGLNASETLLTPANVAVNSFGKLHTTPVDGHVYAEPLVETAVTIADGANTRTGAAGLHDVVFVATQTYIGLSPPTMRAGRHSPLAWLDRGSPTRRSASARPTTTRSRRSKVRVRACPLPSSTPHRCSTSLSISPMLLASPFSVDAPTQDSPSAVAKTD